MREFIMDMLKKPGNQGRLLWAEERVTCGPFSRDYLLSQEERELVLEENRRRGTINLINERNNEYN